MKWSVLSLFSRARIQGSLFLAAERERGSYDVTLPPPPQLLLGEKQRSGFNNSSQERIRRLNDQSIVQQEKQARKTRIKDAIAKTLGQFAAEETPCMSQANTCNSQIIKCLNTRTAKTDSGIARRCYCIFWNLFKIGIKCKTGHNQESVFLMRLWLAGDDIC